MSRWKNAARIVTLRRKVSGNRFDELGHAFDVPQVHQRDALFTGDQRKERRVVAIQVVEWAKV